MDRFSLALSHARLQYLGSVYRSTYLVIIAVASLSLIQSSVQPRETDITGYGDYVLRADVNQFDFTGWDHKQNLF